MEQALSLWNGLDMRRRIIVILATVGVFFAVLGLARMAAAPSMALLYAGLEPAAAGEVVTALEAQGAVYEVRGSAIYVDAARRDALRMTLAGDGLPMNGAQGYELLDTLSGFGTTSQMFDAAYWRAKEGELARTIAASPHVRAARVHISNPSPQPFLRGHQASASVTVTPRAGALSAAHAHALRYLVASAVSGLDPGGVAVIDAATGTVLGVEGDRPGDARGGEDLATRLRQNVERLLAARVGPGNAAVEVSVETVTQREQIVERIIDPDSRVAISAETEERTNTSTDSRGGAVTVASNLPDGDAAAGDQSASSSENETRERTNFELSETQREVVREPGAIRRLTVAVLVNGLPGPGGTGDWQPRDATELEDLRALVASAVGFDEARGDEITIRSMRFVPLSEAAAGTGAAGLLAGVAFDPMSLIQLAVLAVVALALGFFVLRPILIGAGTAASAGASSPELPPPPFPTIPPPPAPGDLPALSGEIADEDDALGGGFAVVTDFGEDGGLPALPGLGAGGPAGGDPVERLRQMIEERQEESIEILRGWMEDGGAPAQ